MHKIVINTLWVVSQLNILNQFSRFNPSSYQSLRHFEDWFVGGRICSLCPACRVREVSYNFFQLKKHVYLLQRESKCPNLLTFIYIQLKVLNRQVGSTRWTSWQHQVWSSTYLVVKELQTLAKDLADLELRSKKGVYIIV